MRREDYEEGVEGGGLCGRRDREEIGIMGKAYRQEAGRLRGRRGEARRGRHGEEHDDKEIRTRYRQERNGNRIIWRAGMYVEGGEGRKDYGDWDWLGSGRAGGRWEMRTGTGYMESTPKRVLEQAKIKGKEYGQLPRLAGAEDKKKK
jgi:hypothetical protein